MTSNAFGEIWNKILERCPAEKRALPRCDRWRIATMIVGADHNDERPEASPQPFLRQLVHGPFDVDKLDYIARDGYFTGLCLPVDVDRLLWVLDTIKVRKDGQAQQFLCVSASGATVLEQVLFSKMQLFCCVYHHHKVRAAHQAALRLFALLKNAGVRLRDLSLGEPENFMCLDDYDILDNCFQAPVAGVEEAKRLAECIRNRTLPKRALVLTHPAWGKTPESPSEADRETWYDCMKTKEQPEKFEAEVAHAAGVAVEDIWIDIPDPVNVQGTGQEGWVKFDPETYMPIQEMFPVGGWLSAYQSYRSASFVFAKSDKEKVGKAAIDVLSKAYGIDVNNVALKLARIETGIAL